MGKTSLPSSRSPVWQHFIHEGKDGARCIRCGTVISTCGNTTNMWSHLRNKHNIQKPPSFSKKNTNIVCDLEDNVDDPPAPKLVKTAEAGSSTPSLSAIAGEQSNKKPKPIPIADVFAKQSSFKQGVEKDRLITEAVINMIVKDTLPFNTPEKEGFRNFVKVCVPLWKGISRRTITRMVDAKYDFISSKLQKQFPEIKHICLTTDICTDIQQTKSYLGVTAHYLDNTTIEMETVMLDVVPLDVRHTAVNLASEFENVLKKWSIKKEQITAVVTDNGANIKLAAEILLGPNKHVSCIAHTLNLIPIEAMKSVPEIQFVKDKVKGIVTYCKRSVLAADALRESQEKPGAGEEESQPLKLIQEVMTRFYSTYLMLSRFYDLKDHIASVLIKLPGVTVPDMLTNSELAMLKELIDFLKPFQEAITSLSAEKSVTCSKVIPLVHCISKTMEKTVASSSPVQQVKANLLTSLKKRFGNIEKDELHALSTLVDPRFKRIHFADSIAHANVISRAADLVKENQDRRCQQAVAEERGKGSMGTDNSLWSHHNSLVATVSAFGSDTGLDDIPVELQQYLGQLPYGLESDPFDVWKGLREVFPNVHALALKYLPIPASSIPRERLFSKAGRLISEDRNRLDPKIIIISKA